MGSRSYQDGFFVDRRKKKHVFSLMMLFLIMAIVIVLSIYNMIISSKVGVEKLSVTVNALPSRLEGTKILVMSDLHGASFGINQSELVKMINGTDWDVLCVVGDVTDERGSPRAFIRILEQLEGGRPVLFIPGDEDPAPLNTDALSDGEVKSVYIRQIEQAGAVYLDVPYRWEVGGSVVWFCPEALYTLDLDAAERTAAARRDELLEEEGTPQRDAYLRAAEYQLDRLERIREAQRTMQCTDIHVALSHVPLSESGLRDLHDRFYGSQSLYVQGISLVLSGHYNAGQWRVPWGGAFFIPSSFNLEESGFFVPDTGLKGAQSVVGVVQVITPGLNVSECYPGIMRYFRLFNQPSVTLVTMTRKITD